MGKRPLSIDDKPMSLWHAARKQRDYRASPRSGPVVFHPFLSKKSSGKCKSLVGAAGGFPDPADGASAQASDPRRGHHAECGEDLGAKAAGQRVLQRLQTWNNLVHTVASVVQEEEQVSASVVRKGWRPPRSERGLLDRTGLPERVLARIER